MNSSTQNDTDHSRDFVRNKRSEKNGEIHQGTRRSAWMEDKSGPATLFHQNTVDKLDVERAGEGNGTYVHMDTYRMINSLTEKLLIY
jgi:hypothetical protein